MKTLKQLWQKFGILLVVACGGLVPSEYIWNADLAIALKVGSIISMFLMLTSLALDDRKNKGLFPYYDEDALIQICEGNPIAASIVIFTKNFLLAVILILAVMFVK